MESSPDGEVPRIRIEITPTVNPKQLTRLYRVMRGPERRGVRPPSEAHMQLAAFATERNDGRTWEEVMKAWNHQHPDRRRAQLSNFRRDCHQAYWRLTGRKLIWRRRRGAAGHR